MSNNVSTDDQLLSRTLRVTAILLGACVLFVGALSLVAVLVTSKAFGSGAAPEAAKTEPTAKKPLSI
ncbi:MAG TPA: hypothetical protein VIF62_22735 [Labilithrix sp.]|jgi:hypothetical protein